MACALRLPANITDATAVTLANLATNLEEVEAENFIGYLSF